MAIEKESIKFDSKEFERLAHIIQELIEKYGQEVLEEIRN